MLTSCLSLTDDQIRVFHGYQNRRVHVDLHVHDPYHAYHHDLDVLHIHHVECR